MKKINIRLVLISLIIGFFVGISIKKNPVIKCDLYECVTEQALSSIYAKQMKKGKDCGFSPDELNSDIIITNTKRYLTSKSRDSVITQINHCINEIYGNN